MKDRLSKISSLMLMGLALYSPYIDANNAKNYGKVDVKSEAKEMGLTRITEFGQYGHMHGLGSLGFTDEGREIQDVYSFVDNAIARHRRAEEAFGRPLKMHIDLPSYYTRYVGEGETFTVFNENTGAVIQEYFDRTKEEGIEGTLSICIVPPIGSTKESISEVLTRTFSGDMPGLPLYVLSEHINQLSLTIDFEYMVMGDFYRDGGPVNYIPIDLVHDLNNQYISLHKKLQIENVGSFKQTYMPQFAVYNFGINHTDDMYEHRDGIDLQFPPNALMISDAIGTMDFKAESAKNFSEVYGIPTSTMFFIPDSPQLWDDGKQSDTGISPWDYDQIVQWTNFYSRAERVMVH